MACNLSSGRQEPCKESIGGLSGVYFINYVDSTSGSFALNASSEVTSFPTASAYYYQLKGTSAYTETVNTSRENGTTFFSQELTLNLKKITQEMSTQLKLMAYGRPQIVVVTNNGDSFLVGRTLGADVTAGTIQTGAALGDLYGYSVTFTGTEPLPANFISGSAGSAITNPFGNATNKPTIVYGASA
jgi:hypothetical protein